MIRSDLLQAILSAPDDDLPRLAAADYLDDIGSREAIDRAAFIRAQVENPDEPQTGIEWNAAVNNMPGLPSILSTFRRGFVSRVRLPQMEFTRHARELFLAHPITRFSFPDNSTIIEIVAPRDGKGWQAYSHEGEEYHAPGGWQTREQLADALPVFLAESVISDVMPNATAEWAATVMA